MPADTAQTLASTALTPRRVSRRNPRLDGRSRVARRIRQLVAEYNRRLGDAANDSMVRADIVRLAETEALIEDQRACALRHEPVDLAVLTRLENAARRWRRSLGLDGLPPEPPPPTLESYLRAKAEATP